MVKYLGDMDVSIMEADNGQSAFSRIQNSRPHLVITDINMPGMDGYELLEQARKNQNALPFITITGDQAIGIDEKVFQLGANDFIRKPFSKNEIVARVRRFI